jgi:hypothetical protein
MLIVYPDGNKDGANGKYIRPTPLITISQNALKNKMGQFGSSYEINLNGTIVTSRESTVQDEFEEVIPTGLNLQRRLPEIIARQNELREYFSRDGLYIEILDIDANAPKLSFYAKVNSINFDEGTWVDICRYTISLTADYLIDSKNQVTIDGITPSGNIDTPVTGRKTVAELFISSGLIEEFNDTWSIETDESNGSVIGGKFVPRSYRLTRNMTATGKNIYGFPTPDPPNPFNRKQAWEHARDFIKYHVDSSGGVYSSSINDILSSGLLLNMPSGYAGFNHIRSENLDKAAGTYSVSDSYVLSPSGETALENYNVSIQSGKDNAFTKVSIDGNIKGLSPLAASGYLASGNHLNTPYDYAYGKYLKISNSGQFGIGCDVYKRANNSVASKLNAQPNSISLGVNESNGEITYNLEFDNRPTNYFSGVLSESINVQDTYPGDVFAVIPVIGRSTGPVLQYIGGRTEYKRDITIDILVDYTDIGYNHDRASLMLTKPSLNEPIRSQLNSLINDLSPATEPYIRKYFLNPPSESWSPKEGSYSLSLSWVYELDR